MKSNSRIIFTIPDEMVGKRIDKVIAVQCKGHSRSSIQAWIKQGLVIVDDEIPRQKDKVLGGERVEIEIPEAPDNEWQAQEIRLDVVYEDEAMLVIDKPAGLVVHPGAGNPDSTLLNGLLFYLPQLLKLPRAGIVHRLDKDTSGLMVVAKTEAARLGLIRQLVDHSLHREYLALVHGKVISGSTVDEPISRDKHDRRKMTVNALGKEAVTHYRVDQRFRNHTLLRVKLETGRTHQIRVHMRHIGFPLVGDPVYANRLAIPGNCTQDLEQQLRRFKRQALHATKIEYEHPISYKRQAWHRPVPSDLDALLQACSGDLD